MSASHLSFFNSYAERVAENGFTVTPTKGKKPVVRKWQNPAPTDAQWLGKMLQANRYASHNLGIVCGRVVGIDVDADDAATAARLEALAAEYLGPTPFQRVGRAPRTLLLYRPAAGEIIPSLSGIGGCIDVLSNGRQFVAFGIHPGTGKAYVWGADNPATAKLDGLPVVTAASVHAFTDAVATALGSPPKPLPPIGLQPDG
jgi:Bifunctional DNA primase/polymerase, N-terminal